MKYAKKYPEHIFVEEVGFCPTQIYYYFTDKEKHHWCAYLRQRRQSEVTFEFVATDEFQEFSDDYHIGQFISLSRKYNFNIDSEEEMLNEIHAMEKRSTCVVTSKIH
ncbi:MAG: hypothetical protein IKQ46_18375 [Bacteroidales bacterium]|nr:hypothetical protein [Bacteroidales bacterium]